MRYINPDHTPTRYFNIIPLPKLGSKVVSFIPAFRQKYLCTSLPCVLHTPPINVCSFPYFLHFEIDDIADMFEECHKTHN